jgi:hypothetical protein
MHIEAPAPSTIESFRDIAKWASIIAIAAGYHVFLGWVFDIDILKSPWVSFSTMKANSAICSMLAGIALYFLQTQRTVAPEQKNLVVRVCAGLTAIIALLSLAEYVFGFDVGFDEFLFPEPGNRGGSEHPGRMAVMSAFAFSMIGVGLLLLDSPRRYVVADMLALVTGGNLVARDRQLYVPGQGVRGPDASLWCGGRFPHFGGHALRQGRPRGDGKGQQQQLRRDHGTPAVACYVPHSPHTWLAAASGTAKRLIWRGTRVGALRSGQRPCVSVGGLVGRQLAASDGYKASSGRT